MSAKPKIARLVCSGCGVEAACDCGVKYVSRVEYARKHMDPAKSNRANARDLGVDDKTVAKARADISAPDEKVVGLDGRAYPAKRTAKSVTRGGEVPSKADPARSDRMATPEQEDAVKRAIQALPDEDRFMCLLGITLSFLDGATEMCERLIFAKAAVLPMTKKEFLHFDKWYLELLAKRANEEHAEERVPEPTAEPVANVEPEVHDAHRAELQDAPSTVQTDDAAHDEPVEQDQFIVEPDSDVTSAPVTAVEPDPDVDNLVDVYNKLGAGTNSQKCARLWVEAGCPIATLENEHWQITEKLTPFRGLAVQLTEQQRQTFLAAIDAMQEAA